MKKKIISMILGLVLVCTLVPTKVFAADDPTEQAQLDAVVVKIEEYMQRYSPYLKNDMSGDVLNVLIKSDILTRIPEWTALEDSIDADIARPYDESDLLTNTEYDVVNATAATPGSLKIKFRLYSRNTTIQLKNITVPIPVISQQKTDAEIFAISKTEVENAFIGFTATNDTTDMDMIERYIMSYDSSIIPDSFLMREDKLWTSDLAVPFEIKPAVGTSEGYVSMTFRNSFAVDRDAPTATEYIDVPLKFIIPAPEGSGSTGGNGSNGGGTPKAGAPKTSDTTDLTMLLGMLFISTSAMLLIRKKQSRV